MRVVDLINSTTRAFLVVLIACAAYAADSEKVDRLKTTSAKLEQIALTGNHVELNKAITDILAVKEQWFVQNCLLELLRHDNWRVLASAAYVCGQQEISYDRIKGPLIRALDSNGSHVAKLGPGRLPRFLAEKLVYGEDDGLRDECYWSLKWMAPHDEAAVKVLIEGLNRDDDIIREECAALLGEYGNLSKDAVSELIEFAMLPWVPPLNEMEREHNHLKPQNSLRTVSARSLGGIGLEPETVIPLLESLLNDPDIEMRRAASFALAKFGLQATSAIPRLVELLLDPPYEGPFCATCGIPPSHWAGDALVSIGPGSIPALTEALKSEHAEVRRHAANALGFFREQGHDAVPALVEATRSADEKLRNEAIRSLGMLALRPKLTVPCLLKALRHEDAETRSRAAFAFGSLDSDDPRIPAALRSALDDTDGGVLRAVEYALQSLEFQNQGN